MAQDNENNAPPTTRSDSMSPGKDNNRCERSKSSSQLVVAGAINKGKGVAMTDVEEGCRSTGKNITPQVLTAHRDGRSGGRSGGRELHMVKERHRRKRVSEMFTKLHGLLPTLPDKVGQSSIVMEAVNYIKSLEGTLSELEKRKLEKEVTMGNPGAVANGRVSSVAPVTFATPHTGMAVGGIWPTMAAPAPAIAQGAVIAAMPSVGLQTWSGPNFGMSLSGNNAYINMCVPRRPGVLMMVLSMLEKHHIDIMMSGISSDHSQCMLTIQARINEESTQFGGNMASEEIYKRVVSEIMNQLYK